VSAGPVAVVEFPAPLPVEREELIVVEIRHGVARTELVHLPARRALAEGRGGPTFDRFDFPPDPWPSACRKVPAGSIYVRSGMLAGAPICPACVEELG
jgi:hypothetical protein